jgi:hypothetical protein
MVDDVRLVSAAFVVVRAGLNKMKPSKALGSAGGGLLAVGSEGRS